LIRCISGRYRHDWLAFLERLMLYHQASGCKILTAQKESNSTWVAGRGRKISCRSGAAGPAIWICGTACKRPGMEIFGHRDGLYLQQIKSKTETTKERGDDRKQEKEQIEKERIEDS